MNNNSMTIGELQERINQILGRFSGVTYNDIDELHTSYRQEIEKELRHLGIGEMTPCVWGVLTKISDPIEVSERIAEIMIKSSPEMGVFGGKAVVQIYAIKVAFWTELLPMTLSFARKSLIKSELNDRISAKQRAIQERCNQNEVDRSEIDRLSEIKL